jgi:hypothetical protein
MIELASTAPQERKKERKKETLALTHLLSQFGGVSDDNSFRFLKSSRLFVAQKQA